MANYYLHNKPNGFTVQITKNYIPQETMRAQGRGLQTFGPFPTLIAAKQKAYELFRVKQRRLDQAIQSLHKISDSKLEQHREQYNNSRKLERTIYAQAN